VPASIVPRLGLVRMARTASYAHKVQEPVCKPEEPDIAASLDSRDSPRSTDRSQMVGSYLSQSSLMRLRIAGPGDTPTHP